jgi:uncharacterized membrane protein (DUF4010 family)
MLEFEIVKNFLIAMALGALIGLEREYAMMRRKFRSYAGIRTFPLIALFGALAAYFGDTISIWILIVSILILGGLIVFAYYSLASKRQFLGATSEIAGLITFFIGVLCYQGELMLAVVIAIGVTILLYARSALHHFAEKIKQKELVDTLKFIVIAFVVLPFLPNKGYGPLEMFNPYIVWLMVVFISGISFAGYILMKWLGERGITLAGILGGLVSSTAVTISFAERSKRDKKIFRTLVLGVILANTIMFVRILIEVFVINVELLWEVILPLSILILVCSVFSYLLWRKAKEAKGKVKLSSPFTLGPALKFGAFFAVILALVKVADVYLSSKGVYLVSFISGFADVDAITVSLSQLSKGSLGLEIARNGIILAALTNVAVKGGIAYIFGDREKFGKIILLFYIVLILLGLGLMWLL